MSKCGSGGSSKGGGSKSKSKGGRGDALHKKVALQTNDVKEHLSILRSALRDELGNDRDVLAGFGPFTKFDRNGLELDVSFRTGTSISDDELEWAHALVTSNLAARGQEMDAQALMDDLCDPSSRYYLVTERAVASEKTTKTGKKKKSAAAGKPVAFAHFRFTVQGEVRDAMAGEPVLLLRDLHVVEACRRRGVGKHLCSVLELTARKNAMRGVMILAPVGEAGVAARAFIDAKLRGFERADAEWTPSARNLSAFAKSLVAAKPAAVAAKADAPTTAGSPDSILKGPDATEATKENATPEAAAKLETAFEKTTLEEPAPPPAPAPAPAPALFGDFAAAPVADVVAAKPSLSFADFGTSAPEEDASEDEDDDDEEDDDEDGDGDWQEVDAEDGDEKDDDEADDILSQLVELFKTENGRDPTEEEMAQWVETLKAASEEGGLQV